MIEIANGEINEQNFSNPYPCTISGHLIVM